MTSKNTRDPVVRANGIKIVESRNDEEPEFWLVSNAGGEFPVRLHQLHDLMDVLEHLHDEEHHH